jgi:hypothetical protein
LKVPEGTTLDPIIQVEVLNEKKFTTSKEKIGPGAGLTTWNEHLFFEPKGVVSVTTSWLIVIYIILSHTDTHIYILK